MQPIPTLSKNYVRQHLFAVFFSVLILCLPLSACSLADGGTPAARANAVTSAPTIDATLKNQADTQLQTFQQWIALARQYGSNVASYQQQYAADQQALQHANNSSAYRAALSTLGSHVVAIQLPALKAEGQNLQQRLQQAVATWGQQHKYHNAYDNTDYPLGYEYSDNGIGGWAQTSLSTAKNVADYQQAIENLNMYLSNFQAMTTNFSDKTPYNQPHNTDLQLMQQNSKMNGNVIVVSLLEQAMRVYSHGKLVNSFLVTTGRPIHPSIPGVWWVESKQAPTVFKSDLPPSDPSWYPDTPINYAMQYHSDGYFIHDSWWRADYGPGTNYPHADASGDIYSTQGSHGCVNLSKGNAAWVFGFVQLYTSIIIY